VRGLPRLTDRHEYTHEEIAQADFAFHVYEVLSEEPEANRNEEGSLANA